jgi:hypothetical protein
VNILLNDVEARALGALVEKEITTPDYYPLSLHALVNACNQRSSRDPVMNLGEDEVTLALDGLSRQGLAGAAGGADSRVPKYEQRLQETFNFDRREAAILCLLLLRGPQTPGELRGRAERMHHFGDLDEVHSALRRLMEREPPLAQPLSREPGTKETRYAHLLSGDVQGPQGPQAAPPARATSGGRSSEWERIERLEAELVGARAEIAELKRQLAEFRKQFE